jgi:hypothetical protein
MIIESKRLNQIKTFGIFSAYPTLFMFPALFSGNTLMVRKTTSDVGHYVWVAQQLNEMKFPWSRNMLIGAPNGVPFWSPASIVNGLYWIVLWLLTRIVPPIVSVNLTLLIGWILSGVCAYALARKIGANYVGAIAAGISLQMLPWFREKLLAHPLYIFWCVPIIVLILAINFVKQPEFKNLVFLVFFLILSFFIDLYWFWYSVDVVAIVLIANIVYLGKNIARWPIWQRVVTCSTVTLFPLSVFLAYGALKRRTSTEVTWERPLEIASAKFIDQFQGSLLKFLTPPPEHLLIANNSLLNAGREDVVNYVGVSVVCLAAYSLFANLRKKPSREMASVWVVAIVFSLFTIPTSYGFFGLNFGGLVDALRVLNPGLRVFSRTGMIAQAALCVLAGLGVSKIIMRVKFKNIIGILLFLTLVIDLNPFARRLSNDDYKEYAAIRESLSQVEAPATLELWPALYRLYFPRYYINSEKSFTWGEYNDRSEEVMLHASRGVEDFYQYLNSRGITHVLIPHSASEEPAYWSKWGRYGSIDLKFDTKYFNVLATSEGEVPASLLELRQGVPAETCIQCSPYYVNWSGVHFGFAGMLWSAEQDSNSYLDGSDLSWVLAGENPSFQISSSNSGQRTYEVVISMVPAFGPQAHPQVVSISSSTQIDTYQLTAGMRTDVALFVKSGEPVVLKSYLPCVVPAVIEPGNTDLRELCYGVTNFTVKEIFP